MNNELDRYPVEDDADEINLRDYLMVVKKRKWLILLLVLVAVSVALIGNYRAVPWYTASSQVMIERNFGSRGFDNQYYYGWDYGFLETQSEIIRSVNVCRKVVDSLGLADRYRRYFFDDGDAGDSFLRTAIRDTKKKVKGALAFFSGGDAGRSSDRFGMGPEGAGIVGGSRIGIEPLGDEEIIARQISGELEVTPVKDTAVVTISYSDRDPAMARMITNQVVKGYMDEMLEIKLASSSYQLKWMTDKAAQEREKLEIAERALQQYMRDNDLVTVEDRLTVYPQKLSDFSSQLSRAEAERGELEALLGQIDAAGDDFDRLENIPIFADSRVLTEVREEIYQAGQKIKELSKKYGPKHPLMIKAGDDVKVLEQEKRAEIRRVVDATKNAYNLAASKEKSLKELLAETKQEVLNLNEKFIQYSILRREVDATRLLYDTLQTNIKTENVTEQSQSVNIWVIEEADLPVAPSYPNKSRTLMLAVVLGLFGGIGLAFLIEYLDNTVKSEAELEKRYGKTVLGSVEKLGKKKGAIESYMVKEPLSPLAESYRLIRSNLLLSSAERPPATVAITSMDQGEGKTTTVVNLARVLAQDGRTVLIIGCDLRRPRIHTIFNVDGKDGLSSYLSGNTEEPPIQPTAADNLAILPAGPIPPNPAELLGSKKMRGLLEDMKATYDFILLDSPPVQSVTDPLTLSSIAEGTIVVIQHNKTTYETLTSGIKKLTDTNSNILGFVINSIKKSESSTYYSTYYK